MIARTTSEIPSAASSFPIDKGGLGPEGQDLPQRSTARGASGSLFAFSAATWLWSSDPTTLKRLAVALRRSSGSSAIDALDMSHSAAGTAPVIADRARAMILALLEPGDELGIGKMAAATECTVRTVRRVLDDLVAADLVVPVLGKPRWRLTTYGASWVRTPKGLAVIEFGRSQR